MNDQKLYIVRKYVMAGCVTDAIKNEKGTAVHDVWIDDDWAKAVKQKPDEGGVVQGFKHPN